MITNFNNDSITKIVDQILNYDETSLHYSSENPLGQLNQLIINEITFDKKIIESEYLIEKKLTKISKQIFSHLNNNKNRSKFIENIHILHSKDIIYLDDITTPETLENIIKNKKNEEKSLSLLFYFLFKKRRQFTIQLLFHLQQPINSQEIDDLIIKTVDQILNYNNETNQYLLSQNPLTQLNELITNKINLHATKDNLKHRTKKILTETLKQIFSHLNNNKNRSKFINNISKLHSKEITYLDNSLIQEIIQETKSVGNLKIIEWKTIAIFSSIMLISMIFIFKYLNIKNFNIIALSFVFPLLSTPILFFNIIRNIRKKLNFDLQLLSHLQEQPQSQKNTLRDRCITNLF